MRRTPWIARSRGRCSACGSSLGQVEAGPERAATTSFTVEQCSAFQERLVPREWVEGVARLRQLQPPRDVRRHPWRQVAEDCGPSANAAHDRWPTGGSSSRSTHAAEQGATANHHSGKRPMTDRPYYLVLYGATGFAGRQTLASVVKHGDGELRFAIAGRSRDKLDAVRAKIGGSTPAADVLVVDSHDQPTVDGVAARTRVLLNAAGPFSINGDAVVDACVRFRTHYVDITGETAWVRRLIDRYDARCAAEGTRIIPFCGFDSVPSELGVWLAVRHAWQAFGVPSGSIKTYFQVYGGLNGG